MKNADNLLVTHVYDSTKTDLTYNFRPEYIRDTYEADLMTKVILVPLLLYYYSIRCQAVALVLCGKNLRKVLQPKAKLENLQKKRTLIS